MKSDAELARERAAEREAAYRAALEHERDQYLALGKKDRAAEVDAELARVGHKSAPVESADAPPAAERAVAPARRGRPKKVSE